jgi:hypothetical protein
MCKQPVKSIRDYHVQDDHVQRLVTFSHEMRIVLEGECVFTRWPGVGICLTPWTSRRLLHCGHLRFEMPHLRFGEELDTKIIGQG